MKPPIANVNVCLLPRDHHGYTWLQRVPCEASSKGSNAPNQDSHYHDQSEGFEWLGYMAAGSREARPTGTQRMVILNLNKFSDASAPFEVCGGIGQYQNPIITITIATLPTWRSLLALRKRRNNLVGSDATLRNGLRSPRPGGPPLAGDTHSRAYTSCPHSARSSHSRRQWASSVFIALSWLFFTLSLALATLSSMALTFQRHHVRDAFERGYKSWRGGAGTRTAGERGVVFGIVVLGCGMWLMLLVCLAFVFLSLSVASYCLAVGWISFVVSVGMMVVAVLFWVLMIQRD
ncbi:hypothetical protein EDD37DRAFT_603315 [Exophiala viscosa]|uniref:Uncharacterized protein n=1 Tax=Exophiala viscosa TaxID=2486360 RepID=A0AAN6DNJ5_9EURO|nr:hypothetical protein EDD36DRAFT_423897 [Exophiala viscosa]KAI1628377.1 hypothetical protein EDD37DRAFT_603315 [Exophiala viscosa]